MRLMHGLRISASPRSIELASADCAQGPWPRCLDLALSHEGLRRRVFLCRAMREGVWPFMLETEAHEHRDEQVWFSD